MTFLSLIDVIFNVVVFFAILLIFACNGSQTSSHKYAVGDDVEKFTHSQAPERAGLLFAILSNRKNFTVVLRRGKYARRITNFSLISQVGRSNFDSINYFYFNDHKLHLESGLFYQQQTFTKQIIFSTTNNNKLQRNNRALHG
jgi:hypothetical protein